MPARTHKVVVGNYWSHWSKWMPFSSFQEAPAISWRWRWKTWGFTSAKRCGVFAAAAFCAVVAVGFAAAFCASSIQWALAAAQSTFEKSKKYRPLIFAG